MKAPKRLVVIGGAGHTGPTDTCDIGNGGLVQTAIDAGLPIPASFDALYDCTKPVAAHDTWPVYDHFVTAQLRWAFGIDKQPVGLDQRAAKSFRPIRVTYRQVGGRQQVHEVAGRVRRSGGLGRLRPSSARRTGERVGEAPQLGHDLAARHEPDVDRVEVAHHGDVETGTVEDRAHRVQPDESRAGDVQRERRPGDVRHHEVVDRRQPLGEPELTVEPGPARQHRRARGTRPTPRASRRRCRGARASPRSSPPATANSRSTGSSSSVARRVNIADTRLPMLPCWSTERTDAGITATSGTSGSSPPLLEVPPHRAGHDREHDVVDRHAERVLTVSTSASDADANAT